MEFEKRLKVRKLSSNQNVNEKKSEPEVSLMDLPTEVLEIVASFLHRKQLKNFGFINKHFWQFYQLINRKNIDLSGCFRLDEKKMLDKARTRNYVALNLNYCHWLSSEAILELISKKNIRELKLNDCDCTSEVMEAIFKLKLTSLSISLSTEWSNFFVSKARNSIPCLNNLKKLKVFYPEKVDTLINHVTRYILHHCHNLEYLKLFTYPVRGTCMSGLINMRPQNVPTPVPKLETLILDVHSERDISKDVCSLLELIFNEKEIPLKRIELGKQTVDAKDKFLFEKNVPLEKTRTVCFSSTSRFSATCNLLNPPGFENAVDSMLKAPSCKRIEMENLNLAKLNLITQKIIQSENTSIEEINFRGCFIKDSKLFSQSIVEIANFCPRINFLDISNTNWNSSWNSNSDLMESLSNLTNLRTLYLTPSMLNCQRTRRKIELQLSLRKMAGKCKFLENFRIVTFEYFSKFNPSNLSCICEDVLSDIKFFENLRELHLVDFATLGNEFAIQEIAKSCTQLTHLYIKLIYNKKLRNEELSMAQILAHTKHLEHLSLIQNFTLTEKFVDSLIKCPKIERLCVKSLIKTSAEVNKYFASNLQKLTKLEVFFAYGSEEDIKTFRSAIDEIEENKRPVFYGHSKSSERTVLPLAHRDLLQYFDD